MIRPMAISPAVLGLLFLGLSAAHAEAPQPQPSATISATIPTTSLAQSKKSDAASAVHPAPLSDEELAQLRGEGESITIANQQLNSLVSNPSVGGDLTSGDVSLSDNALSSFNGLGNIVINTGSQVSVQSGMNVTINVNQ